MERKREGIVKMRRPAPSEKTGVSVADGVMVIITQAFCPNGHNLVRREDVVFDGYPGVSLFVEAGGWSGEVILSPIHGDHSKVGMNREIEEGVRGNIKCPECKVEFPKIADCNCGGDGDLIGIYLSPAPREGDMVGVCNILGCYRSRVMDGWELLSEFVEEDD